MALPPLLIGFFCAGALAASMSTGDAIVHAAASICVKDFAQAFLRIKMSANGETRLIRILVFVIGVCTGLLTVPHAFVGWIATWVLGFALRSYCGSVVFEDRVDYEPEY